MELYVSIGLVILLFALIVYFVSMVAWVLRATALTTRYVELERANLESRIQQALSAHVSQPQVSQPPTPPKPASPS